MSAPVWLDSAAYPFRPHFLETGEGRLHYVDEGVGPAVVLIHGTPTWSFLYRDLIARLAASGHRVIAVDHLGFGLSDTAGIRSPNATYRPEDHARRLGALLDSLALSDVTLVVHDFGGPIGLSYAIEHPDHIARLVVLNSWLWALDGDTRIARGSRIAASQLGRFLSGAARIQRSEQPTSRAGGRRCPRRRSSHCPMPATSCRRRRRTAWPRTSSTSSHVAQPECCAHCSRVVSCSDRASERVASYGVGPSSAARKPWSGQ